MCKLLVDASQSKGELSDTHCEDELCVQEDDGKDETNGEIEMAIRVVLGRVPADRDEL